MNRISKVPENKAIYNNIIVSFTVAVVCVIFILSFFLYIIFESILLENIYNTEVFALKQSSYSAEVMSELAGTLVKQLYNDNDVQKLRYFTYDTLTKLDINKGLSQINNYRAMFDVIHSIYVYNGISDIYYASTPNMYQSVHHSKDFFDKTMTEMILDLKHIPVMKPIPRQFILNTSSGYSIDVDLYTFIIYDSSFVNGSVSSAVIINVKKTWMQNIVNNLNSNNKNNIFIIDTNGNIVLNTENTPILTNISDKNYIKRIINDSSHNGYFIDDVEGTKSLIIYSHYNPYGWIFVSTTPYNSIVIHINRMKKGTIIFSMLVLIIGIILSYLRSKQIVKPINNVISKLSNLETEVRSNFYTLKQDFLKKLILNKDNFNNKNISLLFNKYQISIVPDNPCAIMLLVIDDYHDFCQKNNTEDRDIFKFAIMNVVSEICSAYCKCECADIGDDSVVVILNISENTMNNFHDYLTDIANNIQQNIKKYLNISLSCAISRIDDNFLNIHKLYEEARSIYLHRMIYGHRCIVFIEDSTDALPSADYLFPAEEEKLLTEYLVALNLQQVKTIFNQIIDYASSYSYTILRFTLTHLAFSVSNTISIIEKNSGIIIDCDIDAFINKLSYLETIEEINNQFYNLFDEIVSKLEIKTKMKHEKTIEKAISIIDNKYMDLNLSAQYLADLLDISPVTLGRLFKAYTSKSIPDYINEVRMNKAKHLILNGNISINEIVEKTGYSNIQYFYKVFKKTFHVTPSEMRKNLKK